MKKEKKTKFKILLPALLSFLCVIGTNAQTWDAPVLPGSALTSGTSYYMYNVGSGGYLVSGGGYGTQAVVSAQPRANASTSVIKWTATNTGGSIWTFQYNLNGSDLVNWFLCPTDINPVNGFVYTDNFDFANRIRTWNVVQTDAVNNIYSIQIVSSYGGYVESQFLGSAAATESTNRGIASTVKYNRPGGDNYTQWKFTSQADYDLYDAKVLLDKYMTFAKNKGMDVTSYITIYNAGVIADINTAANNLLTALDRVDVTSSITNPSFESSFTGWSNASFVTQNNVPSMGWTKVGTFYAEKWIASGSNLGTNSLTQTVSGLSSGLYELVVSGHAVQQAGANPLHTGAFISAGLQTTEVVAGKDYSISNIVVAGSTLTIGYSLQTPIACNWTGFDNFRLYYYGPLAIPVISTSKTQFAFIANDDYISDNLIVSGANLSEEISISAPDGITVEPTSLASDAKNVTITVTYDGTTSVSGNIVFSSGSTTENVAVTASPNTGCFTPLYPSGNLVTNPKCTDIATYYNWGTTAVVSDGNAYCGSSIRATGDGGGSIDYLLTGKMLPNTTYRLKAMMYANGNGAALVLNGCGIGGSTDKYYVDINTNGSWQMVDFTFVTGTLGASQNFWFNSFESISGVAKTATDIRLDNFEIYALPTWNGTGNWSTAANWAGTVPFSGADIVVMSGTLTIDQNVSVANVTVYPGAKVILSSGSTLTVTGNLTINSDATGTGTFVDQNADGGLTVNGTTTVQQYLSGANISTVPSGRFWYVSSPVIDATSAVFNAAGASKLWYYTESAHAYTEITDNSTKLTVGKGYVARLVANTTVSFTGTLHAGSMTVDLTRASDTNEKRGYNLIGNPYPSFLDYDAVTLPSSVMPTIWTRSYNASGNAMAFDTYNSELEAGVSGSGATITHYIAPMQAFWVKVAEGNTSGTITFTNAMRYVSDQTVGTNKLKTPAVSTQQLLRLQVSNGSSNDEALIAFNENASNDFDRFDSPKMPNDNATFPEIYTLVGSEKVAINGLKSLVYDQVLPLGFKTGVSNTFTIKVTEKRNFDADTKVVLKDYLLNSELDITDGTPYTFTSDAVNNATRFGIVFKSASFATDEKHTHLQLNAYVNENGQITINSNAAIGQDGMVTVYNAVGQKLVNTFLTGHSTVINKSFISGVYFVTVNVAGKNTTYKLIINL